MEKREPITLKGELYLGYYSSASQAITDAQKTLSGSTKEFEEVFSNFNLTVDSWSTRGVELIQGDYYVQVVADGTFIGDKEKVMSHIDTQAGHLYSDINGFVPLSVA